MSIYRISKKEPFQKPLTQRCIILDLDETLVHSCEDYKKLMALQLFDDPNMLDLRRRMYNISLGHYTNPPTIWGISRPYTEDFLLFCFGYFSKVCVWSAGTPEYVEKIVDNIFPTGYQPHVVYARNHCHYAQDGELFKPITKMVEDERWHVTMRLDNTLFVDDRVKAFIKNPDNGITIPPYEPSNVYEYIEDDLTLVKIMDWLMQPEVLQAQDIRLLDKSRIFT